jgi:hypothetical protein
MRQKRSQRIAIPLLALLLALLVVLAVSSNATGSTRKPQTPAHGKHHGRHAKLIVHDSMRQLWEEHVLWTRLFIVSDTFNSADLQATTDRLLRNQDDIGNAFKPFFGSSAGTQLTALLRQHILQAAAIITDAKAGDAQALQRDEAAWYANANQIADFLHDANPHAWSRTTMRAMMKTHLDQTLAEAQHRLGGDFAADIRDYDAVHRHILEMADTLSDGIMRQFPKRFR